MILDGKDGWETQPDGKRVWVTAEARLKRKLQKRHEERQRNAVLDVQSLMNKQSFERLKRVSGPAHLPKRAMVTLGMDPNASNQGPKQMSSSMRDRITQNTKNAYGSKLGNTPNGPKGQIQSKFAQRLNKLVNRPSSSKKMESFSQRISAAEREIKNMERKEDETFDEFAKRVAAFGEKVQSKEDYLVQKKKEKTQEWNRMHRLRRKERQQRRKIERKVEEKKQR